VHHVDCKRERRKREKCEGPGRGWRRERKDTAAAARHKPGSASSGHVIEPIPSMFTVTGAPNVRNTAAVASENIAETEMGKGIE
jgi:hypothetical protein